MTTDPNRLPSLLPAAARGIAAMALVCLLSHGATAQDSDDDSILPYAGSSPVTQVTPGVSGGSNGNANEAATASAAVLVAGDLQEAADPALATIDFESMAGETELVTDVEAEEATFVAEPAGVAAAAHGAAVALQASGTLNLHPALAMRLVAAQLASARMAVLVLSHDGPTLADEVSGKSQPELVVPLGDVLAVDLVKLAAIAAKHAEILPGYHATVVFLSVGSGELRLAAVRAHTDGGPLEVFVR